MNGLKRLAGTLFGPYAPGFATRQEAAKDAERTGESAGRHFDRKMLFKYLIPAAAIGGLATVTALAVSNRYGSERARNDQISRVERTVETPVPQIITLPTVASVERPAAVEKSNEPANIPVGVTLEYCKGCTEEQAKSYLQAAQEDFDAVARKLGIENKGYLRLWVNETGYSVSFYSGDSVGTGVGAGHDDFSTDRRALGHEIGHAVREALIPTYHSWFDEGFAMYGSGEINGYIEGGMGTRIQTMMQSGSFYWTNFVNSLGEDINNVVPSHQIGAHFFAGLVYKYNMTPQENATAVEHLRQRQKQTGGEITKNDILVSYSIALAEDVSPLFDSIGNGIKLLYSTDHKIAGTEGVKINQRIRNEF